MSGQRVSSPVAPAFRSDQTTHSTLTNVSRDGNQNAGPGTGRRNGQRTSSSSSPQHVGASGSRPAAAVGAVASGSKGPPPRMPAGKYSAQVAKKLSHKRRKRPNARDLEAQGMLDARREANRLAVQRHRQRSAEQAEKCGQEVQKLRNKVAELEKLAEVYSKSKIDEQTAMERGELKDLRALKRQMTAAVGDWKKVMAQKDGAMVLQNMMEVVREQFPHLTQAPHLKTEDEAGADE